MPNRTIAAAVVALGVLCGAAAARGEEARPAPTREAGRALLAREDFEGAEAVFASLVALDDADAESWYLLGLSRHGRRDFAAALAAHRKAATFARVRPGALYNTACALSRLGKRDEALAAFREAVAAGFRDRKLAATDEDLADVRSDERFSAALQPWRAGADAFVEKVRVLHEIEGDSPGEQFGWEARAVGDLDGDGVADFAASASSRRAGGPNAGRVTVYSSKSGRKLFSADGKPGDGFGMSVAPAGDVDGDGTPDIVVGATQGPSAPGYVAVLSGKSGAEVLRVAGEAPGEQFGLRACGVGDVDGDGRGDLAVTAWRADGPEGTDAGRVTVHSGRTGATLHRIEGERAGDLFGSALDSTSIGDDRYLATGAMDAGPGRRGRVYVHRIRGRAVTRQFLVEAGPTGADFGQYFVAFAGDVDGDGAPDVCASDIADSAKGPATGRVIVASGRDGRRLLDLEGRRAGEAFGSSRSVCGDVDGDGHADLCVGAWQNADGAPSGGRCYVLSGKDGATLATFTSRMEQDTLGFDAVGLADVDGDGATDFLLSAAWSEVHGARTGRVFVVAGPVLRKK